MTSEDYFNDALEEIEHVKRLINSADFKIRQAIAHDNVVGLGPEIQGTLKATFSKLHSVSVDAAFGVALKGGQA